MTRPDPTLPDFTLLLAEIPRITHALLAASNRWSGRGDTQRALHALIVADSLDMSRELIEDLCGTEGSTSSAAASFSQN